MLVIDEDPLASPADGEPCWCGSGKPYAECHGAGPRFGAGAPVPDEPAAEGGVWIAPDAQLSRAVLEDLVRSLSGASIYMPTEEPHQRALTVSAISHALARVDVEHPPLHLGQIAVLRMDALDALGLGSEDENYLRKRLAELDDRERSDLRRAVLQAAIGHARPPTSRCFCGRGADVPVDARGPRRLAGQTLLGADWYLVSDETFEQMLRWPEPEWLPDLAAPLAREARLRPLLEAGAVGLAPEEAADVLVAEIASEATEQDLGR